MSSFSKSGCRRFYRKEKKNKESQAAKTTDPSYWFGQPMLA